MSGVYHLDITESEAELKALLRTQRALLNQEMNLGGTGTSSNLR
jgi:hypothetical protein